MPPVRMSPAFKLLIIIIRTHIGIFHDRYDPMTNVIALEAGQSTMGTFEPIILMLFTMRYHLNTSGNKLAAFNFFVTWNMNTNAISCNTFCNTLCMVDGYDCRRFCSN